MNAKYMSKETCMMIRGGAALIIVLHHISGYTSFVQPIHFIFQNIGALMATIFFFYSGYGLMYNLRKKENYMETFITKRMSSVLIPYIFANVIYIAYLLVSQKFAGISYYLDEMSRGYTLLPYSWYVIAIIVLYCIFYISFRWMDIQKGSIVCISLNIVYMLVVYGIGFGEWWYNTCFAFSFGILFALYYDTANRFLQKRPIQKFICFAMLFLVLLVVGKFLKQALILMLVKAVRTVVFCICMLYLSMLLKKRIAPLSFLGKLSFEIYLYQGLAIEISWELFKENIVLFVSLVLILTLLIAFVMNKADSKMLRLQRNK